MSGKRAKRERAASRARGEVPKLDAKREREQARREAMERAEEARKHLIALLADNSPEREAERREAVERIEAEKERGRQSMARLAALVGSIGVVPGMSTAMQALTADLRAGTRRGRRAYR